HAVLPLVWVGWHVTAYREGPCLGVGVVTDDPDEVPTVATQLTTAALRYLAQLAGATAPDVDLAPHLAHATRYTQPITSKQLLQLAVFPVVAPIWLPPDHLALFTLTSRY